MTITQAAQLAVGDEVYWNDPDNGLCSRYYTIGQIEINGEIVKIWDYSDGSYIECFANELC